MALICSMLLTASSACSPPAPPLVAQSCPSLATSSRTAQQTAPPLYVGLDAYRHWDKLSYLELGDRVEGASTADLAGSNADSSHILRLLPNSQHVLFDQTGPGIV